MNQKDKRSLIIVILLDMCYETSQQTFQNLLYI